MSACAAARPEPDDPSDVPAPRSTLSALDDALLRQGVNIGAVARFAGPVPSRSAALAYVEARLHRIPRTRQKLSHPLARVGRRRWIDDPAFDLTRHVRFLELPTSGKTREFGREVDTIFSKPLDPDRPLWEAWIIGGLPRGEFAVVTKTFHAVIEGASGADLITALYDLTPHADPGTGPSWSPKYDRSPVVLGVESLVASAGAVVSASLRLSASLLRPAAMFGELRAVAVELGKLARAERHAPDSPIAAGIGDARHIAFVRTTLPELRRVRTRFEATTTEVVLSVLTGGMRTWLARRGDSLEGAELQALVVTTAGFVDVGPLAERLSERLVPLPVAEPDPVDRLRSLATGRVEAGTPSGMQLLDEVEQLILPTLGRRLARAVLSSSSYDLLVTNLMGSKLPLYFLGRPMRSLQPVGALIGKQGLSVAMLSHEGVLNIGIIGDRALADDIDLMAAEVADGLKELRSRAAEASAQFDSLTHRD